MNRIFFGCFLQTICILAYALGIGELRVYSSLDEPLRAEIPIFDMQDLSLSNIHVGLAYPEEYDKRGLQRIDAVEDINISIQKNKSGNVVIVLNSTKRMSEPFIDYLINISWPGGQIFKDYVILLDPPSYKDKFNKNINLAQEEYLPLENTTDKIKAGTYGPTKSNESIWQIAQRYNNEEVSLQQLILAIVGKNPTKFAEGNLNGLYQGSELQIPELAEVKKVSDPLAKLEILAHDKAWQEKTPIEHALLPPYIGTNAPVKNNESKPNPQISENSSYIAPLNNIEQNDNNHVSSWWPIEKLLKSDNKIVTSDSQNTNNNKDEVQPKMFANLKLINNQLQEKIKILSAKNQELDKALKAELIKIKNITHKLHELMQKAQENKSNSQLFTWYELGFWTLLLLFIVLILVNIYWLSKKLRHSKMQAEADDAKVAQDVESLLDEKLNLSPGEITEPNNIENLKIDEKLLAADESTIVSTQETQKNSETKDLPETKNNLDSLSQTPNTINKNNNTELENSIIIDDAPQVEPESIDLNLDIPQVEPESIDLNLDKPQEDTESVDINLDIPQADTESVDINLDKSQKDTESVDINLDIPQKDTESVDINLDIPQEEPESVDIADDNTLEFDLNALSQTQDDEKDALVEETQAHTKEDNEHILEFDLTDVETNLDNSDSKKEIDNKKLDKDNTEQELKSPEALDTLLELANTYISMNDLDAARQSLTEVIEYGNKEQKKKAKALLKSIQK